MTVTTKTSFKRPRDEAAEVMRCLRETLREPAFAAALALLVSGNGQRMNGNLSANKKAADRKSAAQQEARVADATTHI